MAYSFMTAISDGTLKSMPITFNYMKVEDIVIHHNLDRLTSGVDYTISNNVITFKNVIPALDRIAVDRMSQRDSLRVNFVEGATFSRENMDDVLTQMLYLTQEAMEGSVDRISPTGVLDLAGNRIINLGDPIDLQDAVPLHLVVDAEKSIYASEAKCKQYRDEALGYKNEAFTYADRAYASELNAKKSEEIALQLLAESAEASKLVTENLPEMRELAASAEESADRAGAMVGRVEDALAAVEDALVEVEDALVEVEEHDNRLNTVEAKLENVLIRRTFEIPQDPSSSLEERYFLFNVNDYSGVAEASFHSNHHVKGKITVSSGYANGHGRINVDSFFNETVNNSARRVCGIGLSSSGDVYVHIMRASGTSTHAWVVASQGGIHIATSLALEGISSATYVDFVDLTHSKVRSGYELFEKDVRVYSPNNKPTPSDIGAVSIDNIVSPVTSGGLFESGSNANGSFIKYPDGTMMCWVTVTYPSGSHGSGRTFNSPAKFYGRPTIAVTSGTIAAQNTYGSIIYEASVTSETQFTVKALVHTASTVSYPTSNFTCHVMLLGKWKGAATLDEPPVQDLMQPYPELPPDTTHERIAALESQVAALLAMQKNMLPYDPEI